MCNICSKLVIKTPERRHFSHCSDVSIVDFVEVTYTGWNDIGHEIIIFVVFLERLEIGWQ